MVEQSEETSSLVPLDLNQLQFVFLLLSLVLSDDDQVSVGALVDVLARYRLLIIVPSLNVSGYLDGIMQNALHVDLPQWRHRHSWPQERGEVPDLDYSSHRASHYHRVIHIDGGHGGLGGCPGHQRRGRRYFPESAQERRGLTDWTERTVSTDSPDLFILSGGHQVLVSSQGVNLPKLPHQAAALLVVSIGGGEYLDDPGVERSNQQEVFPPDHIGGVWSEGEPVEPGDHVDVPDLQAGVVRQHHCQPGVVRVKLQAENPPSGRYELGQLDHQLLRPELRG